MRLRDSAWQRLLHALVVLGVLLLSTGVLRAQPAGAPSEPPATESASEEQQKKRLDEAKELFRKGNQLRAAGDIEGALDYYLRSYRLIPSVPNTLNAALTLDLLGRYDEALDMYTELLTRFGDELPDEDRKNVAPAVRTLRGRLGSLDVSSNVQGAVLLVDGRERGRLPLSSPIPVLPGRHVVRVLRDGFETFETEVEVKVRETMLVDAKLQRLTRVGKLRVEHKELAGGDLFIDGAKVGKLPWEGFLAPGEHLYYVQKEDLGSAPRQAIIVEGQTVLVEVRPGPLSSDLRFVVEPSSAAFFLDSVKLGEGGWQGRLPLGKYAVEARESGYVTHRQTLEVKAGTAGTIQIKLEVDPNHPRWAVASSGKFWLGAFGAFAFAPTFGSDAEDDCARNLCSEETPGIGFLAGARLGWQFPMGISAEIALGYLALSKRLTRTVSDVYSANVPIEYRFEDELSLAGPFASLGAGYDADLGTVHIGGRLHVGLVLAGARDRVTGRATAGGESRVAGVDGSGSRLVEGALFVAPELDLGVELGEHLSAGLGLGVLFFPVSGPNLELGDARVQREGPCPNVPAGTPPPIDCADNVGELAGERAFSQFVAVVPGLYVNYVF